MTKKDTIFLGILAIGLFLVATFVINVFNYYDPLNRCYISIQGDIIRGEKKTIKQAIKLLKREDKKSYATLCKYVDIISEKPFCMGEDTVMTNGRGWKDAPCYVRGSKAIYIKSTKDTSKATVILRKEALKKYAEYSKRFWEGYKLKTADLKTDLKK